MLYIFFSCKKNINKSYLRIKNMMSKLKLNNYIIVVGSNKDIYYKEVNLLFINCNDNYEGYPEKIINTYNFIKTNKFLKHNKYLIKMDDDVIIKKPFDNIRLYDYCGIINNDLNISRDWHFNKCSKYSIWNSKKYNGTVVPYCLGGYSYILSFSILDYFKNCNDFDNEIYEDLYVAKILYNNKIFPKYLYNLTDYVKSSNHEENFFMITKKILFSLIN